MIMWAWVMFECGTVLAVCVCVCVCVRGIWGFNLVLYERCQYMLVTRSEKVCYSEAALVAPQT